MPTVGVFAAFGSTGALPTWTDISAYVRSGNITRGTSRLAGPLYQYQPGTATIVLKNADGRFDPANLSGPYTSATGFQTVSQNIFADSGTWTAPHNMAGSTIKAECWGGGGGGYGTNAPGTGNGAGAGGGGEYACEPNLGISPGNGYSWTVGGPGAGGSQGQGGNGGSTTFTGDTVTVTAHGGLNGAASGVGGSGGSGSVNTIHNNGGHGGSNSHFGSAGFNGGAGGGGSAGTSSVGNAGANTSADSGAAGAGAVTDGGPGGNGGGTGNTGTAGRKPAAGPGGGGGGGWSNSNSVTNGGAGYRGRVRLTYTVAVPASATVTQVLPMVPIQVRATWNAVTYNLFTGYATSWADAGINNPRYTEITLAATDGMYVLAGITLPTTSLLGDGEDTGARVSRVLDSAGWPAGQRNIDPGDSVLQGTTYGDTPLNLIQVAADTEVGEFYVDGSGNVTFRHRSAVFTDPRSTVVQAVLGDQQGTVETDGTELPYTLTMKAVDDTALFNDIQNTRVGGTLQEATDQASVSRFGGLLRTYARSDLLQEADADALAWAQYILLVATQVQDRFDTLTISPQRDPTDLYPQVLGRDMGDLVEVWRRPPGVAAITRQAWIRGITHDWNYSAHSWVTSWTLQNSGGGGPFGSGSGGGGPGVFTLNDPVKGKLDFNALTF
jgi:hypothetical protein